MSEEVITTTVFGISIVSVLIVIGVVVKMKLMEKKMARERKEILDRVSTKEITQAVTSVEEKQPVIVKKKEEKLIKEAPIIDTEITLMVKDLKREIEKLKSKVLPFSSEILEKRIQDIRKTIDQLEKENLRMLEEKYTPISLNNNGSGGDNGTTA